MVRSFAYEVNSAAGTADLQVVNGVLTLTGSVDLTFSDLDSTALAQGTTFTLFNYGTLSGGEIGLWNGSGGWGHVHGWYEHLANRLRCYVRWIEYRRFRFEWQFCECHRGSGTVLVCVDCFGCSWVWSSTTTEEAENRTCSC